MRHVLYGALLFFITIVAFFTPVTEALISPNNYIKSTGTISMSVQGTRPLHVDGKYIKDDLGQAVLLRGIGYGWSWVDTPGGLWPGYTHAYSYSAVSSQLDVVKSFGANIFRGTFAYRFIIQDVQESGLTCLQIIRNVADLCNQKGIYFLVGGFSVVEYGAKGHRQDPLPWVNLRNDVIRSWSDGGKQDWINCWIKVANTLKDLPNVILDPHNEPQGNAQDEQNWFNALQDMIVAVRNAGFSGPILEQWHHGTWIDLDNPTNRQDIDWAWRYSITDPLNNIVISTHQYRSDGGIGWFSSTHGAKEAGKNILVTDYNDIITAETYLGLFRVLNELKKPLLIGELGCQSGDIGEETAYKNQLDIYNQYGIHYIPCFWRGPDIGYYMFTDPNNPLGTLTKGGQIVKEAIAKPPTT